jgi:hypothetical protein
MTLNCHSGSTRECICIVFTEAPRIRSFRYPVEGYPTCGNGCEHFVPRPDLYPNGLAPIFKFGGIPLLLYSSFFCPGKKLVGQALASACVRILSSFFSLPPTPRSPQLFVSRLWAVLPGLYVPEVRLF